MNNSERIFEKFYDVFKPEDIIRAIKSGAIPVDEWSLEKIRGFIDRHDCHKGPESGCECDEWNLFDNQN